jgi:hypothetical protein
MLVQQEIDINVAALKAYDAEEYEVALRTFEVWHVVFGDVDGIGNCRLIEDLL